MEWISVKDNPPEEREEVLLLWRAMGLHQRRSRLRLGHESLGLGADVPQD